MISAGDFRNGVTFEMEGKVYRVVEFQHVKPGKGAAFVRTKLKDVMSGNVLERTFNPTEKVQEAQIDRKDMQYLYNDGEMYYFMDNETYEQLPLTQEELGDTLNYLTDNMEVKVISYKGKVFGIEPPLFVELEITYTEPGFKGDTSTGASKPATTQTGYVLNVPLFVEIGDKIRAPHQGFQGEGLGFGFDALDFFAHFLYHALIVFFIGQFHHGVHVIAGGQQGIIMLDLALQGGDALIHMGGSLQIIPETISVHFLMQLGKLPFHIVNVKPFPYLCQLLAQVFQALGILVKSQNHHITPKLID